VFYALVGLVVCVVVVAVFVSALTGAVKAKGLSDEVERRIAAGDASGLDASNPSTLPWLSKDTVGCTWYSRPMGGSLTSSVVATLVAVDRPVSFFSLSGKLTKARGEGRIDLIGQGLRSVLALQETCGSFL
jgi:hypothetical protein